MSAQPGACPTCLHRTWLLARLAPYLERFASAASDFPAAELLVLADEDLAKAVAPGSEAKLLKGVASLSELGMRRELEGAACWACCHHDGLYPRPLREAPNPPAALIGRGDPDLLAELSDPAGVINIVGARRATAYGREVARTLGRDLAGAGVTVVSGMAFGIDACAHRGALEAGRTVAILACGPDVAYPASHRALWRRIQENGLVLSELPPGTGAWRWAFPARSRIIAALAGMTVVVEAAELSGSLFTSHLAAELGRDVGAVPGPVTSRTSAGPNHLLAGGAIVVRGAEDVLEALSGHGDLGGKGAV